MLGMCGSGTGARRWECHSRSSWLLVVLGGEVVCDSAANHSYPPLGCAVPFSRGVITISMFPSLKKTRPCPSRHAVLVVVEWLGRSGNLQ